MHIACCEDEKIFQEDFQKKLERIMETNKIELSVIYYGSGEELLAEEKSFDLLFLDIEMKEMDGFQVAKVYLEKYPQTKIVYLTSHEELASSSLYYGAMRFLTKPVSPTFLEEAILTVYEEWRGQTLMIEHLNGIASVNIPNILAIVVDGRKTVVSMQAETFVTNKLLKEWQEELCLFPQFFMCNKGILVNLAQVSKMQGFELFFEREDLRLPVAIKKVMTVKRKLRRKDV